GLRDAFELAQRLGELRASGHPLAEAAARFARARRADRGLTIAATDALAQAFTIPAVARIESLALGALDLVAPARDRVAAALMFGLRARCLCGHGFSDRISPTVSFCRFTALHTSWAARFSLESRSPRTNRTRSRSR